MTLPLLLAAQEPPVQRTLGQLLLQVGAYVTALSVIIGAVAWLALPRFKEWLRTQITQPLQETHKSVTVNGGKNDPPTLRDDLGTLKQQVAQLIVQGGATAQRASDLADRLDDVHDIAVEGRDLSRETRDEFREHEEKGEQYLGKVRLVMKTQGIELPDAHSDD